MPATAKAPPAPGATPAPLSNGAAAVLGMIALGARSGYGIRRAAELSLRFFWALGPPQIYAELGRLEEAGLIAGHDDSRGRRRRRSYEVTGLGHRVLAQWVASRRPAPLELRDALMLQLFFADSADRAEIAALLGRIRERSVEALATFEERIMPAAAATAERGLAQPRLVAEFGVALHEFIVDWCDERLANG